MNTHYAAVLADLEQMKADAEDGIRALRRLMSKGKGQADPPAREAQNGRPASSATADIIRFLQAGPSTSYTAAQIAGGIGRPMSRGIRSNLTRLVTAGKISKSATGRFKARVQASAAAESCTASEAVGTGAVA